MPIYAITEHAFADTDGDQRQQRVFLMIETDFNRMSCPAGMEMPEAGRRAGRLREADL